MSRRRAVAILLAASALATALPAAAASAAEPTAPRRDPCLTGQWNMGPAASRQLLSELIPIPGWLVTDGTITTSFRQGRMTYGSTLFIMEGTVSDRQTMKAEASWINESTYRTRNGKFITGPVTSEVSFGEMTGTKDGVAYSVPGPPGRTETLPGGATPYRCTRTTLTWPVPLGSGGTTMATFRRA